MKVEKKSIFIYLLILLSLAALNARALRDNKQEPEDVITLTGRIKIKGNEPMTFVALVTEDGMDYVLKGEKAENLRFNHQLRLVEIKGRIIKPSNPPRPAEVEVLSFKVLE